MFNVFKDLKIDYKESQIKRAKNDRWELQKKIAFLKVCTKLKSKKASEELKFYQEAKKAKEVEIANLSKELINLKYNINLDEK